MCRERDVLLRGLVRPASATESILSAPPGDPRALRQSNVSTSDTGDSIVGRRVFQQRNVSVLATSLFGLVLGEELWQAYLPAYLTALGASGVAVGLSDRRRICSIACINFQGDG